MMSLQPFAELMRFKTQIDDIGERCGVPDMLAQIVLAIANDRAFLFADGKSFCVLRPKIEDGERLVEVWVAYGKRGDAIRSHLPQVKQLALAVGAKYLQFWTALPALNRIAHRLGYTKVREQDQFTIWRLPLCATAPTNG